MGQDGERVLVKGQCSESGKATVGLVSHWPCITDSPTGLIAYERQKNTLPSPLMTTFSY